MEESGGQPDLFIFKDRSLAYVDMVKESPMPGEACVMTERLLKREKVINPLTVHLSLQRK